MRRVEYNRYGGPEVLNLVEHELGGPVKDQVRIRVKAASVNPVDWKIRDGLLKMMTGREFPRGMGEDFAGVVEAVGPQAAGFKVGDRVFGAMELKEAASFAEAILTPAHTVVAMPAGLSFEAAATLPTVAQTAWLALVEAGKLQAGQRVFVNGCMGSVGRCALQIAREFGAEVTGSCSQEAIAEAQALGATQAVDYRAFDPDRFRGRFDIVLDASGNLGTSQCSTLLRGKGVALHINATFSKMLRVMFTPRHKLVFLKTNAQLLARIGELAAKGKLALPVGRTVPLAQAIPALVEQETRGTPKGKVVVTPG